MVLHMADENLDINLSYRVSLTTVSRSLQSGSLYYCLVPIAEVSKYQALLPFAILGVEFIANFMS